MKKTRYTLFQSVFALILCVSMLAGTTFAWFTDSVSSVNNQIAAGTLDVELEYLDNGSWKTVDAQTEVMNKDALWEPGYTEVVYLKITNGGNLALKYALGLGVLQETGSINADGESFYLSDYIRYGIIESETVPSYATREDALNALTDSKIISEGTTSTGAQLDKNGDVRYVTLVVYMPESVGNAANYATGVKPPEIELGLELVATQAEYESDSFGSDYDRNAILAAFNFPGTRYEVTTSAGVETDANNQSTGAVSLIDEQASAEVPAGVQLENGVNILTLEVTSMTEDQSNANITLNEHEDVCSLDVHVKGVAKDNTVPMAITIKEAAPKGLNMGNYKFYHVEDGNTVEMTYLESSEAFSQHNQFKYDPATGDITLYMATFSEIAMVADTENAWNGKIAETFAGGTGTAEDPYLIANADQLAWLNECISNDNDNYGDEHYQLIADINLGGEENANNGVIFYPIGYHKVGGAVAMAALDDAPEAAYIIEEDTKMPGSAVADGHTNWYTYGGAFKGTFDGAGHIVANIYQNTWQLKGNYDGHYWNAAMGLFGYVYGGTVKNLTVGNFSSDGEFTPTGVIAAYAANSTFENIAITKSNPRVYNTGNGGIVGIGGNSNDPDTYKLTFTNITIDNTNKISALWGSWDVACGGLVGMFRGAGHVHMTNCHVAAQIDVFNDVCGNYQYYWYRYAGMMIGTNKNMTTDANGYTVPETSKFHAENCTVHFGEWNDYYYCELVANSLASYTHDHQFSRLTEISSLDEIKSGDTWTQTGNFLLISDDTKTCYHIVKDADGALKQHLHTDAGEETVNGATILKEDKQIVYLPFNQLFTGYGWGVKHIPIDDNTGFTGITILKREVADSVVKFTGKVSTLSNNKEYTIGEIFAENTANTAAVPVKDAAVVVGITNLNESNPVTAVFEAGENWEDGTITFTGSGKIKITIQDYYYCSPTTIEVNIEARTETTKFESKFTGDFLYRVGNANTVALGSLFDVEKEDDAPKYTIDSSKVDVTIEAQNGTGVSGTITKNASDWTKGTIKFEGTGVVKVTITDGDYCIPTELIVEVINAENLTSAKGTTTGGTFVLVSDVNTSTYVNYWNCTVYGNGFTYSLKGAPTAYNSKQGHGILITKNTTLDNLVIVGDVYNSYGAYTNQDYYNTAVDVVGDTTIQNCYIANCAAPVKARSNVTIKNTTLHGGTVANMLIMSGTATLENVTTTNFDDGREMVGMGIVVHSDATESAKLVLNGKLTQYNFISESKAPTDTYAKNLHNAMFSDDCSQYQFGTSPNRYVNTGIISLTDTFNGEDITDNAKTGYAGKSLRVSSYDGYVYTQMNTSGSVNNNVGTYQPTTQGAVPPSYSFDFTSKNYVAKVDGSNDYCYEENGKVNISMDQGDTFNWDTSILTIGKGITNYTVSMDGTDYTGKSIAFNTAGDYKVQYTYTDVNNSKIDENGNITTYSVTYTKTVNITVAVVKATTKHAEFTFGSSNTASTTVTVDNNTYVMPNVSTTSSTIGSMTVNGKTIYYPIVEIVMSDGKTSHSSGWYAYFPVFSGAVTITDYANNGTGDKMTPYNGSTTTMPSGLSVVGDPTQLFKYQSSSAAGNSPVVKNNVLVYSSPSISAKRSEYNTVIQYSYTDNAGATYYYYIGYHAPAQSYSSICVTPDTMVTMADGCKKEIQDVRVGDMVVAWNFVTGKYEVVPVSLLQAHETGNLDVLHLTFEDGTVLKVLGEHGVFDADLNTFVFIDQNDVENYIGHEFVKADGDNFKTVKLVGYEVANEYTTAYTILSTEHYNVMLEDMFTVTPAHVGDNFFNPFNVGEDMKYDKDAVKADIEKYGLYTYADFAHVVTYEQFVALNLAQFKVSVAKGYVTYDGLIYLLKAFVNNPDFNIT